MRTKKEITQELRAHLNGDGLQNDSTTDALYREWHAIPEDDDTDLEAVEKWAFSTMFNS